MVLASFIPIDKYKYLFCNSEFQAVTTSNLDWNYHFFALDFEEGKIIQKWIPFESFEKRPVESTFFQSNALQRTEAKVTGFYWNSSYLFEFKDENLRPKYKFSFPEGLFEKNVLELPDIQNVLENELICCIEPIIDMDDFLFGSYRYKDIWGESFLFSKQSKRIVQFNDKNLRNNFNGFDFKLAKGSKNNSIVFSISPRNLASLYNSNINSISANHQKVLGQFLEAVEMNGDEILVFFELKEL